MNRLSDFPIGNTGGDPLPRDLENQLFSLPEQFPDIVSGAGRDQSAFISVRCNRRPGNEKERDGELVAVAAGDIGDRQSACPVVAVANERGSFADHAGAEHDVLRVRHDRSGGGNAVDFTVEAQLQKRRFAVVFSGNGIHNQFDLIGSQRFAEQRPAGFLSIAPRRRKFCGVPATAVPPPLLLNAAGFPLM